jgi:uncharacterized Fe-S cluster protein YjdI
MAKREYTNGELTVLWDSDKCGHCELCWRELPSVFNPESRPWVSMAGGTTEQIRNQVLKCPTQALSIGVEVTDGE